MAKNLFKGHTASLINHLFQVLLVTYLLLLLVEQIWTGTVSYYLNLNYLLVIVIVIGILDVFSEHPKMKQEKIRKRDYIFIILLGIAGFLIIKFKTKQLGWLSWLISIIAGILIILLSILVLEEDEAENKVIKKGSEKKNKVDWIRNIAIIILVLLVISIILTITTKLELIESLRIIFGSIFVLFIPGFIISFIFFPRTRKFEEERENKTNEQKVREIDWIERIALSFALSIAIVPLAVFYLNLIGLKINLLNSFLTILAICIISSVIAAIRIKKL